MNLRTGVVILPDLSWEQARVTWREAEQRGFHTAWTYDHLSWRSLRDGPWHGAVPMLAAAAEMTETIRLGTLVATPNFRHPALLAKDVMTLDNISGGRFDLGLGAGGTGWDATALGSEAPTLRERASRFDDFTAALDVLLREPTGSYAGPVYQAPEYRTLPGCVQRPRVPFTIAAIGPQALGVAVEHGDCWVTFGPLGAKTGEDWYADVQEQSDRLDGLCRDAGRAPDTIRRMVLVALEATWSDGTRARWDDFTARIEAMGFTDVVIHWPRPGSADLPGCDPAVFEAITAAL